MKRKTLNIIIFIIFLAIFFFSYNLYCEFKYYADAQNNYDFIRSSVLHPVDDVLTIPNSDLTISPDPIDFSKLQEISPSSCAWITIPGTVIDYPLVQGTDNTYFLSHDAIGNESKAGAIYLNCENSPTMDDLKTIIYGHNLKDGTMFSEIHHYKEPDFATEHPLMYVYMYDGQVRTYQVMCVLTVDKMDDNIYSLDPKETISSITDYLTTNSDHIYAEPNGGRLVLLSTCIKGDSRRIVAFQEIQIIANK